MTGFGKSSYALDGELVTVEVSSVNHRFLECNVRVPPAWWALDPIIKQTVKKTLSRGKVTVTVVRRRGTTSNQTVQFDQALAGQYVEAANDLAHLLGAEERLSLNVLARLDGVFFLEETEEDIEGVKESLIPVLSKALDHVAQMRADEGEALAEELRHRIGQIRETLDTVEARLPELNRLYEERLRERIQDLQAETDVADDRIAFEVALMADKTDVTEEVVRLKTHLDHMLELIHTEGPVGRQLDFLLQEVQREVNTLGVKTRDGDVTKAVLGIKSEHEKMREQIQNVE